jgi:cytolysin (calcineurin-like family phosphatase)
MYYCVKSMMKYTRDVVAQMNNVGCLRNVDKSLAYNWDVPKTRFRGFMLQYNPYYAVSFDGDDYVSASIDWFEAELKQAAADGRSAIVFVHTLTDATTDYNYRNLDADDRFQRLLRDYPVALVLVGHYHENFGYWGKVGNTDVPYVYSSAPE